MSDMQYLGIMFGSIFVLVPFVVSYLVFLVGGEIKNRVEFILVWIIPFGVIAIYLRRKWRSLKWD